MERGVALPGRCRAASGLRHVEVVRVGRMGMVDEVRRGLGLGLPGRGESVRTIDPRSGMRLPDSSQLLFKNIWHLIISKREESLTPWRW